jgi:hypothetical protein
MQTWQAGPSPSTSAARSNSRLAFSASGRRRHGLPKAGRIANSQATATSPGYRNEALLQSLQG